MGEQATKAIKLQEQFICPIWTVWFGTSVKVYFTNYHALQMVRALRLNKTPVTCFDGRGCEVAL